MKNNLFLNTVIKNWICLKISHETNTISLTIFLNTFRNVRFSFFESATRSKLRYFLFPCFFFCKHQCSFEHKLSSMVSVLESVLRNTFISRRWYRRLFQNRQPTSISSYFLCMQFLKHTRSCIRNLIEKSNTIKAGRYSKKYHK